MWQSSWCKTQSGLSAMKDFRRSISFSSWREKIAYSIGMLGKELVQGLINLCVFFYCMELLHPEPAFLCALYIGFHFLGTFATPVIGFFIDNTTSRFGKYKPWIFTGTLFNTLALIWMYHIPGGETSSVYINLTMAYTLWAMSFFMIDAASWSMLTIFNSDNSTRDAMASIPCIASSIGTYLLPLCVVPLIHFYPDLISGSNSVYQTADTVSIMTLVISQAVILVFIRTKHLAKRRARTIRRNSHQHMLPPFPKSSYEDGDASGHGRSVENLYANLCQGAPAATSTEALATSAAAGAASAAASAANAAGAASAAANAASAVAGAAAGANGDAGNGASGQVSYEGGSYGYGADRHGYDAEQAQNNVKQCYENMTGYFDRCASLNDDKRPGFVSSADGTAPASLREVYADLNAHDMATARETATDASMYSYARDGAFATAAGSYAASMQDPNSIMNANAYGVGTESICSQMKSMLLSVLKNDQLMVLFICGVMINISLGITIGATFKFLSDHKLMNDHSIFTALIVGSLLQLTCMALYEPMVRMLSRAFVFNFSVYLFLGGILVLFSAHYASEMMTALITAAVILINCSIGMCHVSLTSMTVDTVDYGEFKLSKRNDALIFAMRITSVHLGNTVSFFCFGGAMAATFVFENVPFPLPVMNITIVTVIVTFLCLLTLLVYSTYYKLNGSFYRNVLNNLQYLRQNMGTVEPVDNGPFMLRYALDESTMIVKLKARTRDDILRAMVQKLSKVNAITSEPDFMSDLNQRLELGPCGVAEGIAMPHAKSVAVRRATVVVATLDTPIDLEAMDGRKSDLIFLLASPDDGETHLKLLGRLSLLLNEPGFADKLRACGSTTEIFERLVQCEKHVVK